MREDAWLCPGRLLIRGIQEDGTHKVVLTDYNGGRFEGVADTYDAARDKAFAKFDAGLVDSYPDCDCERHRRALTMASS